MHESEKEFADFLTRQGKTYIYEPKTFKFNGKKYRPDFYCPEDDVYYEVKINLTHGDIVKMLEFKANYPDLKLKVVSPNGHPFYSTSSGRYLASLEEKINFIKSTDILDISLKEFDEHIAKFHKHDIGRSRNKIVKFPCRREKIKFINRIKKRHGIQS